MLECITDGFGAPAGGWITKQDEAQEQGRLELF